MRWLHFSLVRVVLQFSIACLAVQASRGGGQDICKSSCYVQNEYGDREQHNVCRFYYENAACQTRPSLDSGMVNSAEDKNLLHMEYSPLNFDMTAVNFSLQVNGSGEIVLILNAFTSGGENRCFIACFKKRPKWHSTTFNASCVKLPNGHYNATVLALTGTAREGEPVCAASGVRFPPPSTSDVTVLSETTFLLKSKFPAHPLMTAVFPWNEKKNQMKRDGPPSMRAPFLGVPPRGTVSGCNCAACLYTRHVYNNTTALLQLLYSVNDTADCSVNDTADCCASCLSLNLRLFRYPKVNETQHCASLNFTQAVVGGFNLVTQEKNVTQGPIEYPHVGSGCYTFSLRPMVSPFPIYHGFFWLSSRGNVTNMDDWNTTFYLQPFPDLGSLEVKWTAPTYPYNFSGYELQLWHHANFSIKCRGDNLYNTPIVVIPESGKIPLNTTSYHFKNLSIGWYCARVTPVDPRCDSGGCQPRSSLAKLLKDNRHGYADQDDDDGIAPILIGAAAGVLVAGVVLACVVLRCRASHNFFNVDYTKVSAGGRRLGDTQEVLLVWTVEGADGNHLLPVIQAFKKMLTSYGNCKVYDYLDLRSIPAQQREHLLASPTAWLDALLSQQRVKIIVVGTEGGRSRQLLWTTPTGGRSEVVSNLQPHDAQLFPYLLRRLQDRPDLAADYSRVFHVRFNDVSDEKAELEGVVSWTRYRLPQHLRSLILALHGIKEEDSAGLEDPTGETIQALHRALAGHPLYAGRSTANNNSNNHHNHAPYNKTPFTHLNNQTQNHSQSDLPDVTPCVPTPLEYDGKQLPKNHIPRATMNHQQMINDDDADADDHADGETHNDAKTAQTSSPFTCIPVDPEEKTPSHHQQQTSESRCKTDNSHPNHNGTRPSIGHDPDCEGRLIEHDPSMTVKTNGFIK